MNLPAAAARKIPLKAVKEILGLPEGRLERLIHDGALPCEEGGIDLNVLNAAIRKQDAFRRQLANAPAPWQTPANPHVAPLPTGDMGVIELAPGRVTLWGVQPQGRLPGVDYEQAIRETIRSATRNNELAAVVEATIWREMGDPAHLRLDELRDLAEILATSWTALSIRYTPLDWQDRRYNEHQTPGLFLRPRQALETALTLPERLGWTISRGGKESAHRLAKPDHRDDAEFLGGQDPGLQSESRRRRQRPGRSQHRPVQQSHGRNPKQRRLVLRRIYRHRRQGDLLATPPAC